MDRKKKLESIDALLKRNMSDLAASVDESLPSASDFRESLLKNLESEKSISGQSPHMSNRQKPGVIPFTPKKKILIILAAMAVFLPAPILYFFDEQKPEIAPSMEVGNEKPVPMAKSNLALNEEREIAPTSPKPGRLESAAPVRSEPQKSKVKKQVAPTQASRRRMSDFLLGTAEPQPQQILAARDKPDEVTRLNPNIDFEGDEESFMAPAEAEAPSEMASSGASRNESEKLSMKEEDMLVLRSDAYNREAKSSPAPVIETEEQKLKKAVDEAKTTAEKRIALEKLEKFYRNKGLTEKAKDVRIKIDGLK